MAVRQGEIITPWKGDTRHIEESFRRVVREAQTASRQVDSALNSIGRSGSGGGIGGLASRLADISNIIQGIPAIGQLASALIDPLKRATLAGIEFNDLIARANIGFTKMMGGADEAQKHLLELQRFAEKTPFNFEQLVAASQRLQAMGFEGRRIIPVLTDVGDAVAGIGGTKEYLDRIVIALGQMQTKGRVMTQEMNQLTEAGIPAWEMLAFAIGKTTKETMKLTEQGRLRGPQAVTALLAMMRERYGGMMVQTQGATVSGQMSNVEDVAFRAAGTATRGLTQDLIQTLGAGLQRQDLAITIANMIDKAISPVSGVVRATAKGALGGGVTEGLAEGLGAGKDLVKTAVQDLAIDGVITTFKNALGIQSPSKVFYDLGLLSAEGFMLGISAGFQQDRSEVQRIIEAIIREAQRVGIAPEILLAQIKQESGFNNSAVSPKGARSFAQFMPGTGRAYGLNSPEDYRDINKVAAAFADHMRDLVEQFGDIRLALAAYNAGAGAVIKYNGIPPYKETQGYVRSIMGGIGQWRGITGGTGPNIGSIKGDRDQDIRGGAGSYPGMRINASRVEVVANAGNFGRPPIDTSLLPDITRGIGESDVFKGSLDEAFGRMTGGNRFSILDDIPPLIGGIKQAHAAFTGFASDVIDGGFDMREAMGELRKSIPEIGESLKRTFVELPTSIGAVFGNAVRGWDGTLQGFFRSVVQGFGQMLLDMTAQLIQSGITRFLASLGLSFLGGGGISLPSIGRDIGTVPGGPIFAPPPTFGGRFASGGVQAANTWAIVGENGPELSYSGPNARAIFNGRQAGSTTVIINTPPMPMRNATERRSAREQAEVIANAIQVNIG